MSLLSLAVDCADGQEVVNRLKANAEILAQDNDLPYPLSMSVGLAVSSADSSNLTLNQLVSQADAAMYAQKQRRRQLNIAEIKASQRWSV